MDCGLVTLTHLKSCLLPIEVCFYPYLFSPSIFYSFSFVAIMANVQGDQTLEQVADEMESWFKGGAADGFNLMPPVLPWLLDVFVDEVVPLLQRRGLYRDSYEGATLREHYRLPRPAVAR